MRAMQVMHRFGMFDDEPAARTEEAVQLGNIRALTVRAPQNGGINVIGTDSGRYEVTACKAAAIATTLNDIRVRVSGNELTAEGPSDSRWVVYFLVRAPRGAGIVTLWPRRVHLRLTRYCDSA